MMMKRLSIGLFIAVSLLGCAGLRLPDPLRVGAGDWPFFGRTQARTNATNEMITPPLKLVWEEDITTSTGYGSPIIIDSIVLITNMKGELTALNANTGKKFGWVTLGDAIHGSPVIENNVAYVAVTNSRESLVAFDLQQGKVLWKEEYGDIEVTPLLVRGKLYFGNTAGFFFCVDKEKGELAWKYRIPDNTKRKGIRSSATTDDTLIIFGAEDGSLYALDAKYGSERWSYNTGAPVFASPALNNGLVICGNADGALVALDARTGGLVWKFNAGTSIYATPSFTNQLTLIGTTGGKLYALRTKEGSMVWSREFNSVINSSAVVSGNVAYFGTLKKELYAVNVDDGSVVWSETLEGRVKTSPAIASGKLFVATDDKSLRAFAPVQSKR